MKRNFYAALLLLILFFSIAEAPQPASAAQAPLSSIDFAELDAYIRAQMEKHGLQGVSIAITQGDEILYLEGYGSAGRKSMTPQTPMYIGSQSKSFTGLAIAQLIEHGVVDLNAPVRTYIPWFAIADESAAQKITVAHLLHHTSGLSDAGFVSILPADATIEQAVRALKNAKLTAPVGTKFQYFNLGYDVLAYIVETVSGQTYDEYVQQHIFNPLQMGRTTANPDEAFENGLSQGYTRLFGFAVPAREPRKRYEIAAGYIISTAEDMAHYAIALNSQGSYSGSSVLSPQGMTMLFSKVQGYGMGWFIQPGHIYHGGANETFRTFMDLYPQQDLGIVLLINQGYMLDHVLSSTQLFSGIEAIVLGNEPPPVSQGLSVARIGWGLGITVLALAVLHTRNTLRLRGWRKRAVGWSPAKKFLDVGLSFLIPTVILVAVFSQVRASFGDRFNLTYQMLTMFRTLTDITVLMIVGCLPDFIQGFAKLSWVITGGTRVRPSHIANPDPAMGSAMDAR